jgi:hypothetical protein
MPPNLHQPAAGVADIIKRQVSGPAAKLISEQFAWPALLRKLDRVDPSYRD